MARARRVTCALRQGAGPRSGWSVSVRKMLVVWLCFVLAGFFSLFTPTSTKSAIAKDALIKVPDIVQIESGVASPFPIEVTPMDGEASRAIILIKGIPASASLTEGRLFPS